MIDYQAVLADAVRKYQALALIVEGLTQLIDAPPAAEARAPTPLAAIARRALKAGPKRQPAAAKVQRTPAHSRAKAKPAPKPLTLRRGKVAPADWERAKKWWTDGVKVTEIAKRIGCKDPTVHMHAAAHRWPPRPNARKATGTSSPKSAAAPKAKGEKVPMRRCDSCQMTTERDPCHLCGTKWKRTET